MARDTSVKAYESVKATGILGECLWQVYDCLYHHGPLTANECWDKLRKAEPDLNKPSVTPRFKELERWGAIKDLGTRKCSVSERECHFYDVTSQIPVKPEDEDGKTRAELEAEIEELKKKCAELEQLALDLYERGTGQKFTPGPIKRRFEIVARNNLGLTAASMEHVKSPEVVEFYCNMFKVPVLKVEFRELTFQG